MGIGMWNGGSSGCGLNSSLTFGQYVMAQQFAYKQSKNDDDKRSDLVLHEQKRMFETVICESDNRKSDLNENTMSLNQLESALYSTTTELIDAMHNNAENLASTLFESSKQLAANFDYGIGLLVDEIRESQKIQNDIAKELSAIHETLRTPLKVQINELHTKGFHLLSRSLPDKALAVFLKILELDETDIMAQYQAGRIFLYGIVDETTSLIDPIKAIEHLKETKRYVGAEVRHNESYTDFYVESCFTLGISYYAAAIDSNKQGFDDKQNQYARLSLTVFEEVIQKDPDFYEAQYQAVRCLVLLGEKEKLVQNLGALIITRPIYMAKMNMDCDLIQFKNEVSLYIDNARDQGKNALISFYGKIYKVLQDEYSKWDNKENIGFDVGLKELSSCVEMEFASSPSKDVLLKWERLFDVKSEENLAGLGIDLQALLKDLLNINTSIPTFIGFQKLLGLFSQRKVPEVQYEIAKCYSAGEGIGINSREALRWYVLASSKSGQACRVLGNAYFFGIDVPKDEKLATKWFLQATEKGDTEIEVFPDYVESQKEIPDSVSYLFTRKYNFDNMYYRALQKLLKESKLTSQKLQEDLEIDYFQACRIIEMAREAGLVEPYKNAKPARLLVSIFQIAHILAHSKQNKLVIPVDGSKKQSELCLPAESQTEDEGSLVCTVNTGDPQADIYIKGAKVGTTPVTLKLLEGTVKVEFRWVDVYAKRITKTVQITGEETTTITEGRKDLSVGDIGPAGGKIFFDKERVTDGWRYLEAAPSVTSKGIHWYNCSNTGMDRDSKTDTKIGTGKTNTDLIIAAEGTGDYAASICKNLTQGGYNDWFLPSRDELEVMYQNLKEECNDDFHYWSSSEDTRDSREGYYKVIQKLIKKEPSSEAYTKLFIQNEPYPAGLFSKSMDLRVRAVRRF